MYTASKDQPRELTSLPRSCPGAPLPLLIADEHSLFLGYHLVEGPEDHGLEPPCLVVKFERPYAHMMGPPNDEAFSGHPLAARGLRPYAVFENSGSSWIASLERMNSVHPYHDPQAFEQLKHYIFSFHDSTFECIAKSFSVSKHRGWVWDAVRGARDVA
jgi:hypothetical protein